MKPNNKIKTFSEISDVVADIRKKNLGEKIVTTNGAFDLFHLGHLYSLMEAKKYGNILVVGLNSDSSIKKYKSLDRPIVPQEERAEILSALEIVNYVVMFDEPDNLNFLEAVRPDYHVKSKTGYKGIEEEVIKKYGGHIILIDDVQEMSTTKRIEKILRLYH